MKYRYDQLTDFIQQEVATILLMKISNPLLQNITVTRVRMTRDLKLARIFYDVHASSDDRKVIQKNLDKSKGYIRKELAPKLNTRFVPDLEFLFDDSQEALARLDSLFQRLKKNERDR
ncbi:MAG: ribosome-binding factor A [Deltaproteobacteria bacterium RIFCSPLOWO2_02_FULL_50_16]|nr:MAG: ribosome-binding factor A [Deltaproteobacteria bacterium GWA2_50_8]OGQ25700.1 MAG: ribosome-binding factor A [Deltaproteobacteria bacterium RIFCSPHIGHO2_02_FULL_50_15]OGQ56963.1 MAG: ribosome-binding factor A [Deltaproteobacteria bacterium RIFCSPLOWO2_02_FULL_50_16]OGQ68041.1 MAG: ribosome-binding factor A [Deltaproteobacteria bacterium RIFCSPLOWO2_12_FULL_50_11]